MIMQSYRPHTFNACRRKARKAAVRLKGALHVCAVHRRTHVVIVVQEVAT